MLQSFQALLSIAALQDRLSQGWQGRRGSSATERWWPTRCHLSGRCVWGRCCMYRGEGEHTVALALRLHIIAKEENDDKANVL